MRMLQWLIASIVLSALIYLTMPMDPEPSRWGRFLGLVVKLNNITIAGWLGYWLDRQAVPYGRPDSFMKGARTSAVLAAAAMIRRAIIMGAAMIAVALGT